MELRESPSAQVDNFLSAVGELGYDDKVALDIETKKIKALRPKNPTAADKDRAGKLAHSRIMAWLIGVEEATGKKPLLYISPRGVRKLRGHVKGLEAYPLWICDYGDDKTSPEVPTPWSTWFLWQWTSDGGGKSHGMESNGLDLDYLNIGVSGWCTRRSLRDELHHLVDRATNSRRSRKERQVAAAAAKKLLSTLE
jgi:GH25 family lysozyme M1 (1,4-beta-N-acetylmuramidase)